MFRNHQAGGGTGVIQYDSFVHLAYARSVDKKWVFAVLSSSDGRSNIVKTWYVGSSKKLFDEACTRLWELGSSLAGKQYGKICLVLTRLNGTLPDDELMNWRRLSGRNVHLAVVCVDDNTKIYHSSTEIKYILLSDRFLGTRVCPREFRNIALTITKFGILIKMYMV